MRNALDLRHWLWASILSVSAACAPAPTPITPTPLTPTGTPSPTATASPPPSPPPAPSASPSEPQTALYRDDFSRDRGWELGDSATGAVSILNQRLVIAVQGPSGVLYSLSPAPESADFELEVVAHSEICSAGDEFGLMVRARSLQTHYRFSLSCDGSVRASRFIDGREAALAASTPAAAAFAGAPAINRLRLQAEGDRFVFLVNEIPALEVSDSQLSSGAVGLIVRARRSSQTTIAFDDFSLWAAED